MRKFAKIIAPIVAVIVIVAMVGGDWLVQKIYKTSEREVVAPQWNTAEGEVIRDLSYGENYRNRYDLYLPANDAPRALMLFIHGGSWMSGDKRDMEWAAKRYADEGYITASINYTRLESDSLPNHPIYAKPCLPNMVEEIDNSIKAIKSKCAELGCNISQMAIGGYSAGAHLAMLYSTLHATTSPIPIKFQISWVGPSDFNMLFPSVPRDVVANDANAKYFYANMGKFAYSLSGKEQPAEEITDEVFHNLKSEMSPTELVSDNTPPAVLAYGGKDRLVNAIHGEKMSQVLTSKGIANRLIIFPNSGHELGHDPDCSESVQATILEFCKEYFE